MYEFGVSCCLDSNDVGYYHDRHYSYQTFASTGKGLWKVIKLVISYSGYLL